jgi:predicted metal-dependent HD superfamily phosphohydrolase
MNLDRWLQLMGRWGFSYNEETFSSLVVSYSEKGRHYHTQEHVAACLSHLDRCVSDIDKPREVELALWFHDAIYKPLSDDNEKKSADWAASFLMENRASTNEIGRVHRLIMVTEHNAPIKTKDESFIVDIDLSILGADSDIYDVFERGIRSEYKLVPTFIYRKKRAEILQGFLGRPKIFQNELFSKERERQAKENLVNAVTKLGGRITNVAELKR